MIKKIIKKKEYVDFLIDKNNTENLIKYKKLGKNLNINKIILLRRFNKYS